MAKSVGRPKAGYTDFLCDTLIDKFKEKFTNGDKFNMISDRNDPIYSEIKGELEKEGFTVSTSSAVFMTIQRNELKISLRWFFNKLSR